MACQHYFSRRLVVRIIIVVNMITKYPDILSVTRDTLNYYIDNELIQSALIADGLSTFSIIRYISFNNDVLRVVCGGQYPGCGLLHMRNIYIVQLFNNMVSRLIRAWFSLVNSVKILLTTNPDFREQIKSRLHGEI